MIIYYGLLLDADTSTPACGMLLSSHEGSQLHTWHASAVFGDLCHAMVTVQAKEQDQVENLIRNQCRLQQMAYAPAPETRQWTVHIRG